jgi:hypothetical protein
MGEVSHTQNKEEVRSIAGRANSKRQSVVSNTNLGGLFSAKLVSVFVVGALAGQSAASAAKTYGPSLQECRDFAAGFANTCTIPTYNSPTWSLFLAAAKNAHLQNILPEMVAIEMTADECPTDTEVINYQETHGVNTVYNYDPTTSLCRWSRQLCVYCLSPQEASDAGIIN